MDNGYCIVFIRKNDHEYCYHKGYDVTRPFFEVAAAIFALICIHNEGNQETLTPGSEM